MLRRNVPTLDELIRSWRCEAAHVRDRYAENSLAKLCETHAAELESAIAQMLDEELSIDVAVTESGYSASQLRRLFPGGQIRRRDLPRRPGRGRLELALELREARSGLLQETVSDDVKARLDARLGRAGR